MNETFFSPFILAFLLANKQKSPLFPNFRICRFKKDKEKYLGLKREEIIVIFAHSPLFFKKRKECLFHKMERQGDEK